jgi:NADH:ubiquinone oxidoreductase subunit 5 (subunit L)/multisubunit Na+/H+ antiporter MnhA subunit
MEVAVGFPLAVGALALTSGLAAVCFVKAFGITFLAMPRSDCAAQAKESHWSMLAPTSVLAVACVVLGLAAPTVTEGLNQVLGAVPGFSAGEALPSNRLALTGLGGFSQISPLLIAVLLGSVIVAVAAAIHVGGLRLRRADTWGCGRIGQTPRMEYTASAFAEPLRRIFSELYRPTEDLSVSTHAESRYFVQAITYTSHVAPWFEKVFYDPLTRGMQSVATQARRLQAGSVHLYLLYLTAALMVALASAWWFQ